MCTAAVAHVEFLIPKLYFEAKTTVFMPFSVLPGFNNLWACMKIPKVLLLYDFVFHHWPSSHPSHPRTWSRTQLIVQEVTNADNSGPRTVKVPL